MFPTPYPHWQPHSSGADATPSPAATPANGGQGEGGEGAAPSQPWGPAAAAAAAAVGAGRGEGEGMSGVAAGTPYPLLPPFGMPVESYWDMSSSSGGGGGDMGMAGFLYPAGDGYAAAAQLQRQHHMMQYAAAAQAHFFHSMEEGGGTPVSRRAARSMGGPSQRWRQNTPLAGAGGGLPVPLPIPAFLPHPARVSPVKDNGEIIPALSAGVAAIRDIPSCADSSVTTAEASSLAWSTSDPIAKLHSALDFILRTTNAHSKRAGGPGDRRRGTYGRDGAASPLAGGAGGAGGAGALRLGPAGWGQSTADRARQTQERLDQAQRSALFAMGVVPLLLDIISLVSSFDSRQVLEDAIQCLVRGGAFFFCARARPCVSPHSPTAHALPPPPPHPP